MQASLGDLATGLILVAGICGPLAGWLAMRRSRSPIPWFSYGVLTGPIAIALLLAAPPGRCPVCGAVVPGWHARCGACGIALPGFLRNAPPAAPGGGGSPALAARGTMGPILAVDPPASAPGLAASPGPAQRATPTPTIAERAQTLAVAGAPGPVAIVRAGAAGSRASSVRSSAASSAPAEVLATGVYLSGNAGLDVGATYGIARVADHIQIFGPVDVGQLTVRHERPIDSSEIVALDDTLILTLRGGRSATNVVMRWTGGQRPLVLEQALAPGAREGDPIVGAR